MLFSLMGMMLAVFWGIFGDDHKYIAVAAIMAWGPGDAMAAMLGKKFGKHKLRGKMIEGVKSVEGTVAMALTSFICTFVTLILMGELAWYVSLILSIVTAPIAALTELYTKKGLDTVTVPIVSALVLSISLLI